MPVFGEWYVIKKLMCINFLEVLCFQTQHKQTNDGQSRYIAKKTYVETSTPIAVFDVLFSDVTDQHQRKPTHMVFVCTSLRNAVSVVLLQKIITTI